MEKEFVTYEIAVKLKELGFDDDCFAYKLGENSPISFCLMCGIDTNYLKNSKIEIEGAVCLPLWQQATRWLREQKRIFISTDSWSNCGCMSFGYEIYKGDPIAVLSSMGAGYSSEVGALTGAITKAFELLEERKKITAWQQSKNGINSRPIEQYIRRKELLAEMTLAKGNTVDYMRRLSTVLEYLEDTGTPGVYRIRKHIPEITTLSKFRETYDLGQKFWNTP